MAKKETIDQRFEHLRKVVESKQFRGKEGIINEVPFFIFSYPPQEETDTQNLCRPLFSSLEKIHPRYKTPARSIALQGIMAILLLLIVPAYITLLQLEDAQDTFDVLTDYSAFTSVVFYVMAVAAVMVLRWRQPDRERPYRVPGYPLIPIIFLVFNIWFLSQVFINTRQSALIGAGLIMIAIPVYYLMRRRWL